jgi:lipopolysaccharide transport system permease protein
MVFLRYFHALKENQALIMIFALGDLKNRYRNSVLGFFWNILEPLILLSVLYFIFSSIFKPDIPNFAIYLLLGLIMWNFISKSTLMGLQSISSRSHILSNIYFQRAIPALSSNITGLMLLGFEFIVFTLFLIVFGEIPGNTIILLPVFIFLTFIITLGISLPLSVLNIFYKDIQFIWTIILGAGFFLHPIIYTTDMLPENIREIVLLVPTVKIFNMIHEVVLYNQFPPIIEIIYITIIAFSILFVGYIVYRIFERRLGEEL